MTRDTFKAKGAPPCCCQAETSAPVGDVGCTCHYLPPRDCPHPPHRAEPDRRPSAPVGDNGYESFARSLVAKYGFCNWQCEETWAAAQAALAQQPAAVDDRIEAALKLLHPHLDTGDSRSAPGWAIEIYAALAGVTLATQHQEPTT